MSMFRRATMVTLAFVLAGPALAADPGADTQVVRVARSPAGSPGATRRLERRIAVAALDVCGAAPGSVAEMKAATARSQCYRDSYAGGIAQMHAAVASLPPPRSTGRP